LKMSELPKDNQELDKDVDQSRRKLAKIGATAPVIMTLASKPVFGAQCLSQMMSGNTSPQGPGTCVYGWSPGGWRNPVGEVNYKDTRLAWADALGGTEDEAYGVKETNKNGKKCEHYTGGKPFNVFFGGTDATPMREALCDKSKRNTVVNDAKISHWIAAYLNSKVVSGYILSTEQVLAYWNDPLLEPPAPFTSLTAFFDYTWREDVPHGSP
jgi:hypothetical protein